MNAERKAWLEWLKEGDDVCYDTKTGGYVIDKIVKITPTRQIKTASGKTFRGGFCTQNKWDTYYLEAVTDKVKSEVLCRRLIAKIKGTDFKNVPLKKLQQIAEILDRRDTE